MLHVFKYNSLLPFPQRTNAQLTTSENDLVTLQNILLSIFLSLGATIGRDATIFSLLHLKIKAG
jgi:hypothetical protein